MVYALSMKSPWFWPLVSVVGIGLVIVVVLALFNKKKKNGGDDDKKKKNGGDDDKKQDDASCVDFTKIAQKTKLVFDGKGKFGKGLRSVMNIGVHAGETKLWINAPKLAAKDVGKYQTLQVDGLQLTNIRVDKGCALYLLNITPQRMDSHGYGNVANFYIGVLNKGSKVGLYVKLKETSGVPVCIGVAGMPK